MPWDNDNIVNCFDQECATFSENGTLDQIGGRHITPHIVLDELRLLGLQKRVTCGVRRCAEEKLSPKYPVVHVVPRLIRH